ncbi:Histidine ammonia-lyase [Leucobacter sp. 7(1)]|uniref:HAL/PAL/TAL family ammonia-lyase n=1 Tax=Leucobacter sp. 7(1) TaxID=1255613 RepID=UPI00097EB577|nr:histidine ammonia-lyase [Leucobacter sp. 7(1)]SJN08068.1 Histidine ammonia-lyase [Leucobacter sp. 7(1)]
MNAIELGDNTLTLEDFLAATRDRVPARPSVAATGRMQASEAWVSAISDRMRSGEKVEPIYSINTGFGSLAGKQAFDSVEDAAELSRRLIISNAGGIGRYLDEEVVRGAMFIRAASLARGHSACRPELLDRLLEMMDKGVLPAVPEFGSLGASGDLIPLAHLAIVLTRAAGEDREEESGEAHLNGQIVSGVVAMREAGIERIVLGPKEGLALLNGTSFSTAQAALALADVETALEAAQITAAMSIEAMCGFGDAFLPQLHEARGHAGQIAVAARIRELLADSEFIDGNEHTDPVRQPPQDAYSLRCTPQVLGPVKDTLSFARGIIETEINAATDNPLVFPELPDTRTLKAVSGGNFHAEYVAFASDFISIGATEIANIAERRLFRLTDGSLNRGLPEMLVDSEKVGMDCGYMLPQYLAAALVSDCKTLAHPDSVDSIPTSANQEDHVSMANNAGRHARQVAANVQAVIGIELLLAAQALELRLQQSGKSRDALSTASRAALELIRATPTSDGGHVDFLTQDVVMYPRVRAAIELVRTGALQRAVTEAEAGRA